MNDFQQRVGRAVEWLKEQFPEPFPKIGLVLGSGLGGAWLEQISIRKRIPYADIPGFPVSTVLGHAGSLLLAEIGATPIAVFAGRFHIYEGYSACESVFHIRCMGLLGVRQVILTNAAGALNPLFDTGGLMLLTDHINMTGHNPLTGANIDVWGPRFPDMSQVYCPNVRTLAEKAGRQTDIRLERGVYVAVAGPSLETPAETRMFRFMGADAIGMSTVPEAIAAHHMNLKILGISCLTNKNLPDCMAATSHEEILRQAAASSQALGDLLGALIPMLGGLYD